MGNSIVDKLGLDKIPLDLLASSDPGSSNSGPSNSDQPGGKGPNKDGYDPKVNEAVYNNAVKLTADKLYELWLHRPPRFQIHMNSPEFSNRIDEIDHNVVCWHVLDTGDPRWIGNIITDSLERTRYNGVLTKDLVYSLKAVADNK